MREYTYLAGKPDKKSAFFVWCRSRALMPSQSVFGLPYNTNVRVASDCRHACRRIPTGIFDMPGRCNAAYKSFTTLLNFELSCWLAGAPSFCYSETPSQNGKHNSDTAPPAFVPRNLLLEAKREIRVLQERCRELENGLRDLKDDNEKLQAENSKFEQQVGRFEVGGISLTES